MANKVFYDDDARRRLLAGAELLYRAVKTTMGPKGRNVVISKAYGAPTVTHDGVTVAKAVELPTIDDETLGFRTGAELIKQAANKMNDVVGDGTTTVTVLTYHILSEANRLIVAGHNPMALRRGLERAAEAVIAHLDAITEKIEGNKDKIAQVATISAGDAQIGDLIADVMDKIGKDGVATVEEGQGLTLESEVVEGFTFDRGFISPYMVTNTQRMEAVYEKPAIVIADKRVANMQEFLPFLEKLAAANKRDLLLIAEDVEGEVLGSLVLNKLKGSFNAVCVKAPSFGQDRQAMLEDIATLTGAVVISPDKGMNFDTITLEVVGTARKVIVDADQTTIIGGAGASEDIAEHLEALDTNIKNATSEYQREQLEHRRAALKGKVAIIKVGGATQTEIEEKKYRVDDAVAAVKAALQDGIVAGGGVTLANISEMIEPDDDGQAILKRALLKPFYELLTNSGLNPDEWYPKIKEGKPGYGLDVNSPDKLVDLKKAGVIDPTKLTKEVVQNAVSIAGTAMTMGALMVEIPEDKKPSDPNLMQV